ncbi:alpha-L-fucosidase [Arenitalea sp.]|nr:alpha-L-fucosidase [Algibacter sp.]MDA9069814.1 alpha-L-fucosidase [Algibacter sp.]
MNKWLIIILSICILSCNSSEKKPQEKIDSETPEMDEMWGDQKNIKESLASPRNDLFDDGNYAMFIHWGIYSNIANKWKDSTYYGISEWIMNPRRANISVDEYMAESKNFNPVNFNANEIAQLAKDAGMKYIVVTSKHHDGFAMYDSKNNDFNIVKASPFARDPMKELSKACKDLGLGFGFYYSHNQDWTFPGGNGGPSKNEKGEKVGFDHYFKHKCLPQVEEITTEYGDIALVWFDTPGDMEKKYVQELVEVVRKNQPNALISGRAGHGLGDYLSLGDMNIPTENVEGLWETVDVTNDSWGYAWYDENWKSPKLILKNVISTVARGGTYMLNIGPKPDGSVPTETMTFLRESGEWIRRFPQIIYKANASPWGHALPWGDVTVTDNKLNLCVYQWPLGGEITLPGLNNKIVSANLFVDGKKQPIKTSKENGWVTFQLPAKRPEKLISVIEVELDGEPKVDQTVGLDPVYPTVIPVDMAKAENCEILEKAWMEKFGEWKHIQQAENWNLESRVTWEIDVKEPGYYQVDLNYVGTGRTVWRVETDEYVFIQNEQDASHIYSFFQIGQLKFNKLGKHTISVSFVSGDIASASLKTIRLSPIGSMD